MAMVTGQSVEQAAEQIASMQSRLREKLPELEAIDEHGT